MTARILIVDESELVRDLYAVMLRGGGYQVQTVASAPQALNCLARDQFELIVSDTQLPEMDGLEMTRRIRATPGYGDTPIILVAPMMDAEARLDGLRAGANVFVAKPTQTVDLVLHARMLLGR